MADASAFLTEDQMISLALVAALLLISKLRDMLDYSGLLAAMAVGLAVSLLGHWTWLVILVVFLIVGSLATKWRFEEKQALSIQEANEGVRSWRNVTANGATASMIAFYSWYFGGADWYYLALASCVAVAASDTLASEIGSLDPRTRSIINLEAVPPGTNGGMSPTGTAGPCSEPSLSQWSPCSWPPRQAIRPIPQLCWWSSRRLAGSAVKSIRCWGPFWRTRATSASTR